MTTIVKRTNGSLLPASPRALFDDFFNRELFNWGNNNFSASRTTLPSVNIKELQKAFEVEVAAPGMQKEDFSITLDGNMLTIASSKEDSRKKTAGIIPAKNSATSLFNAASNFQKMWWMMRTLRPDMRMAS